MRAAAQAHTRSRLSLSLSFSHLRPAISQLRDRAWSSFQLRTITCEVVSVAFDANLPWNVHATSFTRRRIIYSEGWSLGSLAVFSSLTSRQIVDFRAPFSSIEIIDSRDWTNERRKAVDTLLHDLYCKNHATIHLISLLLWRVHSLFLQAGKLWKFKRL